MWLTRFLGAFLVFVGFFLVLKTQWFLQNFGRVPWAERVFGSEGGTRFFYNMLGLLFIFFGFTMVFGLFGGIVGWVFGPLLPK